VSCNHTTNSVRFGITSWKVWLNESSNPTPGKARLNPLVEIAFCGQWVAIEKIDLFATRMVTPIQKLNIKLGP